MLFKIVLLLVLHIICFQTAKTENNEDIDSVINLLLNGADGDIDSNNTSLDAEEDQPQFSDGIWKCGNCDVINEGKFIYSETYDVDTNDVSDDKLILIQVSLSIDNMRCVTVTTEGDTVMPTVRKETGACASGAVTLAVFDSRHFVVNVYGP